MGWAGGVATDQTGIRLGYRHDGSQSGLAVIGLWMHGQPCSPQGIIFITGFCLYYRHWGEKKIERKVEILKTCRDSTWRDECTRLSNAVSRHNCGHNTLRNPNKQPPVDMGSVSTWLSSLREKSSCLPTTTPLHHTTKKAKGMGEKEKWMSHQCGKPQLALIMSKTYFLWTLLWLRYPIKDYFKALHCHCCCSRSPGPLRFLHAIAVIVSLRTKR